jgi:hypothetical protein
MYDPSLRTLLKVVFGPAWRRRAPVAFGRARRTIERWCSGETRVPHRALVLLERRAVAVGSDLDRWKREQHQRIEQEAREREGTAATAVTWSRLLLIRDKREPKPRVGRPRKKDRGQVKAPPNSIPSDQAGWLRDG